MNAIGRWKINDLEVVCPERSLAAMLIARTILDATCEKTAENGHQASVPSAQVQREAIEFLSASEYRRNPNLDWRAAREAWSWNAGIDPDALREKFLRDPQGLRYRVLKWVATKQEDA